MFEAMSVTCSWLQSGPHTKSGLVMFYVYVLKSNADSELYIGSTNDLIRRFEEHNNGEVQSTKPRRPLKLIYYEAYLAEDDARIREKQLKLRGQARVHLKRRIQKSLQQDQN